MGTREQLIILASDLLIDNGYNAFSYKSISEKIGIKTSSIHYHFPIKTDLGVAVVQHHQQAMQQMVERSKNANALNKLDKLFTYYGKLAQTHKVCIAGALASDVATLEENLRLALTRFSEEIIAFTMSIFEQGQFEKTIPDFPNNLSKARNVVANLMALVQFHRIDKNNKLFSDAMQVLWNELTIKN